jgi:hypothetical protein
MHPRTPLSTTNIFCHRCLDEAVRPLPASLRVALDAPLSEVRP